jgi:hypothetical protein
MAEQQHRTMQLEEVARRLDAAGVRWAVFAGAAATAYGVRRPITDIDILVPAAEGERVAGLFPEAHVEREQDGKIWKLNWPGCDILAGLDTLDLDAEMAVRLGHGELEGVRVPLIPAEDNIVLKAVWGRGAEEGKHDWEDVAEMMACLPTLDWEYLRRRLECYAPGEHMKAGHSP